MRELGKVMLQNYCLDLVRGNLFCAVGLVQKDYHLLVLVVNFKAVVQLFHVEHSTLASPTLFVLADHYEWGEFKDVSYRSWEVVKTLGELEYQMESNEWFWKHVHRIPVDVKRVTQFKQILLE